MFSHYYAIKTVPESNDQGSWHGWSIAPAGLVEDVNHFNAAKEFRALIHSGDMQEQREGATEAEEEEF